MTFTDDAFSLFVIGLIPIGATFLALSGAAVIFLLDRWHELELDYFEEVRSSATALTSFLHNTVESPACYLTPLDSYNNFAILITSLGVTTSTDNIPNYIDWRIDTEKISSASTEFGRVVEDHNQKTLAGIFVRNIPYDNLRFHGQFVDFMQSVDTSIQN